MWSIKTEADLTNSSDDFVENNTSQLQIALKKEEAILDKTRLSTID